MSTDRLWDLCYAVVVSTLVRRPSGLKGGAVNLYSQIPYPIPVTLDPPSFLPPLGSPLFRFMSLCLSYAPDALMNHASLKMPLSDPRRTSNLRALPGLRRWQWQCRCEN